MSQYTYILLIIACLVAICGLVVWLFYRHSNLRKQLKDLYSADLNYFKRHIAVQEEEILSLRQSEKTLKSRLAETLSLHWSEALSNFWAKMQIEIERREKLIDELRAKMTELENNEIPDHNTENAAELELLIERLKVLAQENIELKKAVENWEEERNTLESQITSLTQENNEMESKLREFYENFNRIIDSTSETGKKKKKKKSKKDKSIRKPLAKALKASRQKKKKQGK